ncbi:MAG: RND transporter [Deltaproteobacteria bacterium]|nr:RND transporter [Deltaproteobacteria bacterium]
MKSDFLDRSNRLFASLAGWSFDHRWWVLLLAGLFLIGSVQIASKAAFDNSFESHFNVADPSYEEYLDYRSAYGSDEIAYIVYSAPNSEHGPWNIEVMRQIVQLTETFEDEVPFIYEVQSLANAELMVGRDGSIDILELQDDFPESQESLLELREIYLKKPSMLDTFTNQEASHGALVIRMDRTSTDPIADLRLDPDAGDKLENLYPQATYLKIKEILDRSEYSNLDFRLTGDVPLNSLMNIVNNEESAKLGAITAMVVALFLLIFFRSIVGVIAPTLVVQLGVTTVVAFIVLMRWKLDLVFASVPTLMTAIGVAHSVHILSEFRSFFSELGDRRQALVSTLGLVGTPALLSTLTTAIGFGSMSFGPIKSVAHMGAYSAVGILAIFLLSLTLLMALLSFGPRAPRREQTQEEMKRSKGGRIMISFLTTTYQLVVRRRISIILFSGLIVAVAVGGISILKVDSNWLDDFSDSVPVKIDTLYADKHMGGATSLVFNFSTETPGGIKNPKALAEMSRVEKWAMKQPNLGKATSIGGVVKDLNQTFNEDNPDFYRIPDSRELIAQYLLLYETAGGTDANRLVNSDYSAGQLEFRTPLLPTSKIVEVITDLKAEHEARPLQVTSMKVTGINSLWLKLLEYIVVTQVRGFLIAFLAIGCLLCIVFRSISVGAISMVPNVLPSLLILGVMGWLDIPLDYSKIIIAAVAMGIAVDDTVHFLTRFRHEFRIRGRYEEALQAAMLDVGRAITITSITLVCGFLVLLLSSMASVSNQGILLAGTIAAALIADFLLMPALILTLKPFGKERAAQTQP